MIRELSSYHESCEDFGKIKLRKKSSGKTPKPLGARPYRKSYSAIDLYSANKNYSSSESSGKQLLAPSGRDSISGDSSYDDKKASNKERRFHRLFRNVPLTEHLLARYSCAYVGDMGLLLQGHIYASRHWICFHSNIFGIEKIIEIPVDSIVSINKARTAKIIPNAVSIKTGKQKEYLFGSLMSRDNTHQLLSSLLNCQLHSPYQAFQPRPESFPAADKIGSEGKDEQDSSTEEKTDEADLPMKIPAWSQNHQTTTGIFHDVFSKVSVNALISWLQSLPQIIVILMICTFLLILLLLSAAVLTLRLIYLRNNQPPTSIIPSKNVHEYFDKTLVSFKNHHTALNSCLILLNKAKSHIEFLQLSTLGAFKDPVK